MNGIEAVAATTAVLLVALAACLLTASPRQRDRGRARELVFAFDEMERRARRARRRRAFLVAIVWSQAAVTAAVGMRGWF